MRERHDPAHAGVVAGRVVGLVTAALAVGRLLAAQEATVEQLDAIVRALGIGVDGLGTAYFYLSVAGVAVTRYALAYVVGSLLGVAYDWLGASTAALAGLVVAVGLLDGAVAAVDAQSVWIGAAYVLAWLSYLPVFARLHDGSPDRERPRRLGRE